MNQQPLQEFTLRDFRCFREQQTARLAPLTLLVGENSTGKTSFLAAVRAMLQVGSYHEDPDFRAPPYDLGSFREIAYRQAPSGNRGGADSFGLGFKLTPERLKQYRWMPPSPWVMALLPRSRPCAGALSDRDALGRKRSS